MKKHIVHKGYVYEAYNNKQEDEKTLSYIYDEMAGSLKNLNNVLNALKDENKKKAVASDMKHIRETFNKTIKDPNYIPKDVDELKKTTDAVDERMKQSQGLESQDSQEVDESNREAQDEKYA